MVPKWMWHPMKCPTNPSNGFVGAAAAVVVVTSVEVHRYESIF